MPRKSKRVVIDTNLWISFLLSKKFNFLDALFQDSNITLLFSKEPLEEFVSVSTRPKFKRYFSQSDLQELISNMQTHAEFISVSSTVNLCRDIPLTLANQRKLLTLIK